MDIEQRYQLLDKIGAGSFATVYRARDTELGREVAVKQIHQQYLEDAEQLERYWQEAQLLASLQHPNIVTIYDVFRERGWLILELMQANLAERMAEKQMDLKSLRSTLAHTLRALKYLHERGIIHGDVKPGNLMIDPRRRIKLGDFGLARRVSDEEGSLLKGTTKYMAPEVVSDEFGEVGPSSDLYSLGFAAYDLMCGPNFESLFPGLSAFGRNKQVAWMMWHAAPDRRLPEIHRVLEGVPDDLAHVIQKLCEKDQANRYQSADAALDDLHVETKSAGRTEDSSEQETGADAPDDGVDRRRRRLAIAAFATSAVLSLAMLIPWGGLTSGGDGRQQTAGIVDEISVERGTIALVDREAGGKWEIQLSGQPRILLKNTNEYILLRELQPGDRVEYKPAPDGERALIDELAVARPVVSQGRIRDIDLETDAVVVAVDQGEHREELPVRVPDQAVVLLNGEKVALRDLRTDDRVEVRHLPERDGAGGRLAIDLTARRVTDATGFVAAMDLVTGRLSVQFGLGTTSGRLTLPLAEDCTITAMGEPERTLARNELKPDDRIRFRYDTEIREIVVTTGKQQATGLIQDVRHATGQVSLRMADGRQLDFTVGPQTDVTLGYKTARLEDLRTSDAADVTYDESGEQLQAVTIDARRSVRKDRWAVVIGVSNFDDKRLAPLPFARRDARLLEETLLERYAFSEDRLTLLLDPSHDRLKEELANLLANARGSTQVLVYVATHGIAGGDGNMYLVGKDTKVAQPADTAVSVSWLAEQLESCASSDKLLIVDVCPDSSAGEGARPVPAGAMLGKVSPRLGSTVAIGACSKDERCATAPDGQSGLFARALADGFAGPADADRDVHLTADELFDYLKVHMAQLSSDGPKQTPVRFPRQ